MNNYSDNVRVDQLEIYSKVNENTLFDVYNFLINESNLNNEKVLYIINCVLNKKNIKLFHDNNLKDTLLHILYKKYNHNKKIINKYYPNIISINNENDIIILLKNKYSYILFDEYDNNINYYYTLWNIVHSN